MRNMLLAILAMLALPAASPAAGVAPGEPLPVEEAFAMTVARGADGSLAVEWTIAEGYYLYRDRLAARAPDGTALALETTPGIAKDDPTFGSTEVYYDKARADVPRPGAGPLEIVYQGCQDGGICYMPETRLVDPVTLTVTSPSPAARAPVGWTSEEAGAPAVAAESPQPAALPALQPSTDRGLVRTLLEDGGALLVLATFALFGVLLAFTPCVLPMYPILARTLAREGERLTPGRGLLLSAAYVLGLASAFAALGAAAGWSGQNLQLLLQSPWTVGVMAAIFVALALSMFGLFELQLPAAWTGRLARASGRWGGSTGSTLLLGFASALIVGPCVTAPLAGALLYIAGTGDVALGAAALFALGLGKGLPLLALGTLGGRALPRAGAWMEVVKQLFGFLFLATAVWIATPLLPPGTDLALWAMVLVGLASFAFSSGRAAAAMRTLGGIALIYGVILLVGAAAGASDPLRPLAVFADRGGGGTAAELAFTEITSADELQGSIAAAAGRPTLVYFTADWCVTCRIIERRVLPDRNVGDALSGVQLVKADLTDVDEDKTALMQRLGVAGPPAMLFFGPDSREVADTRLVGNVTVETLTRSASRLERR